MKFDTNIIFRLSKEQAENIDLIIEKYNSKIGKLSKSDLIRQAIDSEIEKLLNNFPQLK